MNLDPKTISDLKEKHGQDLVAVEGPKGPLVFRKPTRHEYDRWRDQTFSDRAQSSRHARELVKCCLVHPDEAGLDAAIADRPALVAGALIDAVTELAGLGEEPAVKKL